MKVYHRIILALLFIIISWGQCHSKSYHQLRDATHSLLSPVENDVPIPGDLNGDQKVDLVDAIIALQIVSGVSPTGTIDPGTDVNKDSVLGVAEGAYALQKVAEPPFQTRYLQSTITDVQPMTGIVLWDDSSEVNTSSIQLEYRYVRYDTIVSTKGVYDWTSIDTLLTQIASRGHQAIIRFYFVYPGRATTVPQYIKNLAQYQETSGQSEGQTTWFPDWTSTDLQSFLLDFFTSFAARYENDARLAFLQVGFGLWGEYHIYDGPMILGDTFPSKAFQKNFLEHMGTTISTLKWSISIDAAVSGVSPFATTPSLFNSGFGLFDDSFLHATHHEYNAASFNFFSYQDRSTNAPMGGELNYYTNKDQREALNPTGPHGISFEQMASQYHISYMIGNDQPSYQTMARIKEAGMATGYRFAITSFETTPTAARGTVENRGIAPMYYDAYVAVAGVRSSQTLKGLLPGESRTFTVAAGGENPEVTIESDRLVTGQTLQYEASIIL